MSPVVPAQGQRMLTVPAPAGNHQADRSSKLCPEAVLVDFDLASGLDNAVDLLGSIIGSRKTTRDGGIVSTATFRLEVVLPQTPRIRM